MYENEFPKLENAFLKAQVFQDQDVPLTYRGWRKKANEDIQTKDGLKIDWKKRVKYCLRYSYPEFALDESGEKIVKDGKPMRNRNYDDKFPKGYSIEYKFDEGTLESGSLPLFSAFCMVRPSIGDQIIIRREGEGKETKWHVRKVVGSVSAQTKGQENNELEPDDDVPPEWALEDK